MWGGSSLPRSGFIEVAASRGRAVPRSPSCAPVCASGAERPRFWLGPSATSSPGFGGWGAEFGQGRAWAFGLVSLSAWLGVLVHSAYPQPLGAHAPEVGPRAARGSRLSSAGAAAEVARQRRSSWLSLSSPFDRATWWQLARRITSGCSRRPRSVACGGLGRPPSGPGWDRRRRPVGARVVRARPQLSRDPLGGHQEA